MLLRMVPPFRPSFCVCLCPPQAPECLLHSESMPLVDPMECVVITGAASADADSNPDSPEHIPHSPSAGAAIHGIFFFFRGFNNFRHSANAYPATDDGLTLGICKPPPVNRQLSVTRKLPFVDLQPLSFLYHVSTIFNVLRWGVPDGGPFSFEHPTLPQTAPFGAQ